MTQKTLDSLGKSSSDDSANGGEAAEGQHADPSAVESGNSSPSLSAEHITTHAPDDVEDWVEERKQAEEGFAVTKIIANTARTLDGFYVGFEYQTEQWTDSEDSYLHTKFGFGGLDTDDPRVAEKIAVWASNTLAVPHAPTGRDFPASRVQVFCAPKARELLSEKDPALDSVLKQVDEIQTVDLPSDDRLLGLIADYRRLKAATSPDGDLTLKGTQLENTIRAKLGWSTRYGSTVPDAVEEYQDWSLDKLNSELDSTEEELASMEAERDDVKEEVQSLLSARAASVYSRHFSSVIEELPPLENARSL